jgi:hypothetical protein
MVKAGRRANNTPRKKYMFRNPKKYTEHMDNNSKGGLG